MPIKFSCTARIPPVTASTRSFALNVIFLVVISIGCVLVERSTVCLIRVVLLQLTLFPLLSLKSWLICRRCLKSSWTWPELGSAGGRLLNFDLIRNIGLFVLCFIVKFGSIGLVPIFELVASRFPIFLLIVYTIGGPQNFRVIATLAQLISALPSSFNWNVMGLVELVIGCVSVEWDMLGWAVVLI